MLTDICAAYMKSCMRLDIDQVKLSMSMDTYTNVALFFRRLQMCFYLWSFVVVVLLLFWCNLMICAVILIVVRSV